MASDTQDDALLEIGRRLRQLRLRRGYTQERLAEAARIQPETISRWETGAVSPSLETIVRVSRALELSPGDLIDEGRGLPAGLSDPERSLVEGYRDLSERQRSLVLGLLEELAMARRQRAGGT